jgi:hypothetical protein
MVYPFVTAAEKKTTGTISPSRLYKKYFSYRKYEKQKKELINQPKTTITFDIRKNRPLNLIIK